MYSISNYLRPFNESLHPSRSGKRKAKEEESEVQRHTKQRAFDILLDRSSHADFAEEKKREPKPIARTRPSAPTLPIFLPPSPLPTLPIFVPHPPKQPVLQPIPFSLKNRLEGALQRKNCNEVRILLEAKILSLDENESLPLKEFYLFLRAFKIFGNFKDIQNLCDIAIEQGIDDPHFFICFIRIAYKGGHFQEALTTFNWACEHCQVDTSFFKAFLAAAEKARDGVAYFAACSTAIKTGLADIPLCEQGIDVAMRWGGCFSSAEALFKYAKSKNVYDTQMYIKLMQIAENSDLFKTATAIFDESLEKEIVNSSICLTYMTIALKCGNETEEKRAKQVIQKLKEAKKTLATP